MTRHYDMRIYRSSTVVVALTLALVAAFLTYPGAATAAPAARLALAPGHIVNVHTNKCLTVYGASQANNALAVQYGCETGWPFNENWQLEDISSEDDYWHIVNQHSGRCLTIQYASTANNAPAVQYDCDWDEPYNEEWRLLEFDDPFANYTRIQNRHSGLCLTIHNVSDANNALVVQYLCDNNWPYNERWQIG